VASFDDPAPLHHLKTSGGPRAFHDDEGPLQHRRDPRDERARIAPSRPDELQAREAGDPGCQDRFGPSAVLAASRMDHHDEEQPQDIDDDVALATASTLAAVIAPAPPFAVVCTV
jgi:hypothetical protein